MSYKKKQNYFTKTRTVRHISHRTDDIQLFVKTETNSHLGSRLEQLPYDVCGCQKSI